MKWAPTVLVLAAFGVLLYVSSKKPKDAAATTAAAAAPKHEAAAPQHEAAAPQQHPAPADAPKPSEPAAKPAPAPAPADDTSPAVETVKTIPAARILPAPPRNPNSIVGVVKDPAGEGVAQIVVRLLGPNGKELKIARTDAGGRFAFDDVAAGSYTLATWDPDYLYTAGTQTAVTAKKDATTDAELKVQRGTSGIRGEVVDGSAKPITDRRVSLTAGGAEISVMTDAKGRFLVNGLAAGDWRVIPDGVARQAKSVKVEPDKTAEVQLVLKQNASIDVTLTGSVLHRADLKGGEKALLRMKGAGEAATIAQPLAIEKKEPADRHHAEEVSGRATFAELEPGEWELEIVDPTGEKSLLHLGAAWSEPISVTLREGESRPLVLPTALAALGSGAEVPTWIVVLMFVVIGGLVLVTPILFPPPLVPKRPAKAAASH